CWAAPPRLQCHRCLPDVSALCPRERHMNESIRTTPMGRGGARLLAGLGAGLPFGLGIGAPPDPPPPAPRAAGGPEKKPPAPPPPRGRGGQRVPRSARRQPAGEGPLRVRQREEV